MVTLWYIALVVGVIGFVVSLIRFLFASHRYHQQHRTVMGWTVDEEGNVVQVEVRYRPQPKEKKHDG